MNTELKKHPIDERGVKRLIEYTGDNLEDPPLEGVSWFFPWDTSEERRDRKDELGKMVDAAKKKCRENLGL